MLEEPKRDGKYRVSRISRLGFVAKAWEDASFWALEASMAYHDPLLLDLGPTMQAPDML